MKKLSIAFLAALSLAAFTGCKKKGGDCQSTINSAVDRMMAQEMNDKNMSPEMKKQAEAMMKSMVPKMKSAMVKSCTDDKWSADMLKCINDAKTEKDLNKCDDKLSATQKANMEKAMSEAMGMPKMGHDEDKAAPTPPPAPAPTEGSAAAPAAPAGSAAPAAPAAPAAGSDK